MVSAFVELFGAALLACLAIGAILSYIGIHVLKREVIFIDIAMAQAAAVGALLAHITLGVHGDSPAAYAFAFGAAFAAAGFYAVVRSRVTQIPLEAVIGVSYAVFAAAALFVLGVAPGGHGHVHRMLAGNLLLAESSDVLRLAVVFAAAGFVFYLCRKPFQHISDNYKEASREGLKVAWWDFLFYALIGVVVTMALKVAGVIVVFAFLIIPSTVSAIFSRRWGARLVIAWITGATASLAGLVFADRFDFSVGPSIALMLVVAIAGAGAWRALAARIFHHLPTLGYSPASGKPAGSLDCEEKAVPAKAVEERVRAPRRAPS